MWKPCPRGPSLETERSIRAGVLRALALNRTPGFHFPGNFLDLSFDKVAPEDTRLSMETGPHCTDARGHAEIGALAMLADFALGTSIRAGLDPATRLATVSMTLELSGLPASGRLEAASRCHGLRGEGPSRVGRSRVVITGANGEIAFGSGAFMMPKPPAGVTLHPVSYRKRGDAVPVLSAEGELDPEEMRILDHAEASLERATKAREPFIRHFWGFLPQRTKGGATCVMPNESHVGNRVRHAQGGVLLGLAAATAAEALAPGWQLSSITAAFISPGEGPALTAESSVIHQGRLTAVLRTGITRRDGRQVLEVMSTHLHRQPQ